MGRFATAIRSLLDDTNLFTRAQWATFLGLSEAALSQWVHDKTIPRPAVLWMMLGVLQESDDVRREPLDAFFALLDIPSGELSRHSSRIGTTLGQYLTRSLMDQLIESLEGLPFRQRESILYQAIRLAQNAGVPVDVSSASETLSQPAGLPPQSVSGGGLEQALRSEASTPPTILEPHAPIFYSGTRVEPFLRTGKNALGVVDTSGTRQELIGLYREPGSLYVEGVPSCACMLWKIPPHEQRFASFPVDEMLFVLLSGETNWAFEGRGTSTCLRREADSLSQLWIPAASGKDDPPGLPPFRVEALGDYAVGLAVFYRRDGLAYDPGPHGQISMPSIAWSEASRDAYWNSMRSRNIHEGRTVPPLQGSGFELSESRTGPSADEVRTLYDPGIREGQLSFHDIADWLTGPGAVLRPQVVRLYAGRPPELADLWLVSHKGIKILLPIQGDIEAISIEPKPAETHFATSKAGKFARARWRTVRVAARASVEKYGDIALICNETWHGMRAVGSGDATVLVINCAADHIGRIYSQSDSAPKMGLSFNRAVRR